MKRLMICVYEEDIYGEDVYMEDEDVSADDVYVEDEGYLYIKDDAAMMAEDLSGEDFQ